MKKPLKQEPSNKKTLYIARAFPPVLGGAENLALTRCLAYPSSSSLIVIAPDTPGANDVDRTRPFTVYRWPHSDKWPRGVQRACLVIMPFLWTIKILLCNRIGTIECSQALPMALPGLIVKKLLRTRLIVWALGDDVFIPQRSPIGRILLKSIFSNADQIVAISRYTADGIRTLFTGPQNIEDKIIIFHPPVDTTRFNLRVDGKHIREKLGIADSLVILTVARLTKRKGIDTVIRVLPDLLRTFPNIVYVVVGSGPELTHYKQLSGQLGIEKNIRFVGRVSDDELPKYYAMSDIFVLLSKSCPETGSVEGFGLVFREAGACGKPVVGSNEGGIPDAVINGINGYTVDPFDQEEIVSVLSSLLADKQLRDVMGNNGIKIVEQEPNWHQLLNQ